MTNKNLLGVLIDSSVSHLTIVLMKGSHLIESSSYCLSTRCMEDCHLLISDLLENSEYTFSDLNYLTCITGPGAYTSLRLGMTTLKSIALTYNLPLIGVSLPDALLQGLNDGVYAVLIPGRKGYANVQLYRVNSHGVEALSDSLSVSFSGLAGILNRFELPIIGRVFGPVSFREECRRCVSSIQWNDSDILWAAVAKSSVDKLVEEGAISKVQPIYAHDVV